MAASSSSSSSAAAAVSAKEPKSGDEFALAIERGNGFWSCLVGGAIDTEKLRQSIVIPEYLRVPMKAAVSSKTSELKQDNLKDGRNADSARESAAVSPVIVFINSKSGGRLGTKLLHKLRRLISDEQVFDLFTVKPEDFFEHGLAFLENIAKHGDSCAQEIFEKMRILVAGGDGTIGWVLSSMSDIGLKKSQPPLPIGIIPLGTGNDLARSFGWGGTFMFTHEAVLKRHLIKLVNSKPKLLDSWQVTVKIFDEINVELPYALRKKELHSKVEVQDFDGHTNTDVCSFEGLFYNYLSIGMDAQIAYGFDRLRKKKPYLARGPITNKLIYSGYTCSQGWFCTGCVKIPRLRGLNEVVQLDIKRQERLGWERLNIPSSVRAIVLLNLNSYASGRNPWGHPKPKYLEKKGFVEARCEDGLLEIFGLKHGWHASFVMTDLINAKHLAQAAVLKFELKGSNKRKVVFSQMDGEPWKHPLNDNHSTIIEILRSPDRKYILSTH